MSTAKLGRLERVPLRSVWGSEAGDFTPWLAKPENIALLGETLQLDLQVEAEEQRVGPFRADILCKDTTTERWVVIENQLNGTDHSHLGQLLTYAAGLQATAIIWVAERFTDEHRAALDWLNQVTNEDIHFFGLEIEAWRIGDSLPAPKFNVVSQPNDWARVVVNTAKQAEAGTLTPRLQAYLSLWQQLAAKIKETRSPLRSRTPRAQHYSVFSIGRADFSLMASVNDGVVWVSLMCVDPDLWTALEAIRPAAEKEAGFALESSFEEGRRQNYMNVLCGHFDMDDPTTWPALVTEMQAKLETLHRVFAHRVRDLEAVT